MRTSTKFDKPSVIIDRIHYFPQDFVYTDTGVHAKIYLKRQSWYQDTVKITTELANEIKAYAENTRRRVR